MYSQKQIVTWKLINSEWSTSLPLQYAGCDIRQPYSYNVIHTWKCQSAILSKPLQFDLMIVIIVDKTLRTAASRHWQLQFTLLLLKVTSKKLSILLNVNNHRKVKNSYPCWQHWDNWLVVIMLAAAWLTAHLNFANRVNFNMDFTADKMLCCVVSWSDVVQY